MNATVHSPLPLRADWPLGAIHRLAQTRFEMTAPEAWSPVIFRVLSAPLARRVMISEALILTAPSSCMATLHNLLAAPWRFLAKTAHVHRIAASALISRQITGMTEYNETLRVLLTDTDASPIIVLRPTQDDPTLRRVLSNPVLFACAES